MPSKATRVGPGRSGSLESRCAVEELGGIAMRQGALRGVGRVLRMGLVRRRQPFSQIADLVGVI
jgi:hypothetical protein